MKTYTVINDRWGHPVSGVTFEELQEQARIFTEQGEPVEIEETVRDGRDVVAEIDGQVVAVSDNE